MAVNKVMDSVGNVLIDLTSDTVDADKVLQGYTFHDKSGNAQVGNLAVVPTNDTNVTAYDNMVVFYDYDGTLIASYTIAEANALTALPTPPSHERLVFEKWNHSLQEVQETTHSLIIGALYNTVNNAAYITFQMPYSSINQYTYLYYICKTAGSFTVDWGDETVDTITASTTSAYSAASCRHTYTSVGVYTIKITPGTAQILLYASSNSSGSRVLQVPGYACGTVLEINLPDWQTRLDSSFTGYLPLRDFYQLYKISYPSTFCGFGTSYTIYNSGLMNFIVFTEHFTLYSSYQMTFYNSNSVTLSIPRTIYQFYSSVNTFFASATKNALILPDKVYYINEDGTINRELTVTTTLNNINCKYLYLGQCFVKCTLSVSNNLEKVEGNPWTLGANFLSYLKQKEYFFPNTVTDVTINGELGDVETIKIPSSVTMIGIGTIPYNYGFLKIVDLTLLEAPPTLSYGNSAYLNYIAFKFLVAHGTLSLYENATNWSTVYAAGLIEEATE